MDKAQEDFNLVNDLLDIKMHMDEENFGLARDRLGKVTDIVLAHFNKGKCPICKGNIE